MRRTLPYLLATALLTVAGYVLRGPIVEARQLPTRLLTIADLVHQGSFTIPAIHDVSPTGQYCEYTNGAIAFNAANQSLFFVCHDWTQTVAEFKIPALGGQATVLQAPRDALEGRLSQINPTDPNVKKIGGMHVSGGQLILTAYSYYDGGSTASSSHFVRSVNLSATGTLQGPFRVGSLNPAFYAGYLAPIPTVWQAALGGDLFTGQCCLSVVGRTSYGPSVSAVLKANLLAAVNPTPATMLVGYPGTHQTLGGWDQTSPIYNDTSNVTGVLLPENTATVVFVGDHGMGTFCYGECGTTTKGSHAPPYEPHVWFYNANDFAAVKAGMKQAWEVVPYATSRLPGVAGSNIGGMTLDPATGRIFVSENFGDGTKPRIHVFTISGSGTPPPPPPPTEICGDGIDNDVDGLIDEGCTPPSPPPPAPAGVSYVVASPTDDMHERADNGLTVNESSQVWLANPSRFGAFQFVVTIPPGTVITSARLQVTPLPPSDDADLRIFAERVPSALLATTLNNITSRLRTVAAVTWTQANLGSAAVTSPDLAPVIQELVNAPGWTGTGRITLMAMPVTGSTSMLVVAPREMGSTTAATLWIETGGVLPPPSDVNCAGSWSTPTVVTSACIAPGTQTVTSTRLFTVTTQPSGGGLACPVSPEVTTTQQACVLPPVPPVDPCVAAPGVVTVSQWPLSAEGSRRLSYSYTVAGVVATVKGLTMTFGPPDALFVLDSRGCTSHMTR